VLFHEPFYLFTNTKHKLSKKQKVRQDEIIMEDLWLLNKGHCFRDQVLNICTEKNKDRPNPIDIETGSFDTLKTIVQRMGGITLLPHLDLPNLTPTQKKMIRPFTRPVPTREVSLITSANSTRNHIINGIYDVLIENVPRELTELKKKDL
jgi:LysR family hydrogen peroxide-inducible transcriptional activator